MIGGGLWDDRGVGQWVDQQDAGQNGVSIPWVPEDRREEDGRLGSGDSGDKGRVVIPKG